MPNNVLAILIDDLGWRMALTADGKPDVRPLAEGDGLPDPSRIAAELRQAGYRGQPLVLAIPTAWCLAAPFSTAGLPRRAGSDLLRFRLEEKLPTPMEELAADVAMRGNTALGVAVPLARVQPVVEALEKEGVVVQWIVPSALAAARAMVEPVRAARSSESASILLIQTKNHIDLVALRDGVPWAWRLTAARPNDVLLHFNSLLIEVIGSPQVKLIGVDDSIRDAVTAGLSDVESSGDPVEHVVVDAVQQYVSGRRSPWIDLRRGNLAAPDSLRLARRPLAIALSAACLLLATLCGVMLWRAAQYEQQAQTLQQQQAGVFRQVFSTGSVPPNPRMRLESEHRALQGRSGQSTDLPRQPSALTRF